MAKPVDTPDREDAVDSESADELSAKQSERGGPAASGAGRRLRDLWLAPTLILGAALLIAGLATVRKTREGPDFDGALRDVRALIEATRFDEALAHLNNVIRPRLDEPEATREVQGRFHALRADALYFAQAARDIADNRNFDAIANEYRLAQQALGELTPERESRFVEALIALGRIDEAADRALAFPQKRADLRRELLKKIVAANLSAADVRYDLTLRLLTTLAAEPEATESDRLWVTTRLATLMLEAGYPAQALERLLREAQRFKNLEGETGAHLLVLLGRAYYDLGRFTDAAEQFERAAGILSESDPARAEAIAYLGRSLQALGKTAEARDQFAHVVSAHPHNLVAPLALLGLAETESLLGGFDSSIKAYSDLVDRIRAGDVPERRISIESVVHSLLDRAADRSERSDWPNALAFAQLAERLFVDKPPPPAALLAVAQARRAIADDLLRSQGADPTNPHAMSRLDPVTRAEARAHYADAADHFLRHARAVILADNDAFADSLWAAGETYDLAGDVDHAIDVFGEYLRAKPDDPREPMALYRLGQLHEARGDLAVAENFFATLIDKHPASAEGTRALGALARVRLRDADPDNDAVAEQLLRRAVSGDVIEPDSSDYRDALLELGALLLRTGRYEEAIERLTEALARYPDDSEIVSMRFQLAEAARRSADQMAQKLSEAMPDSQRQSLETLRTQRLTQAMSLYEQVRSTLEQRDPDGRTDLETARLRNAYFYRADCAFDLGDYETAIRLYDAAAQRYARDPASLIAMAQIVAAYLAEGNVQAARTAQERARSRFLELPEEAFDDASLPAGRAFWEQWLRSRLTLADAQEKGPESQ